MPQPASRTTQPNRWPHRVAVVLACATFPLIWVGAMVTTYDAGMAVPDWPSTYGYNLFLYPWQTWIAGPWDLFIEHGHRLLGAAVGLLAIVLVAVTLRCDRRRWVRHLALVGLAAVILQGCLGGARVLLDDRLLAMIHGCTGPAYFSFCVAFCVVTSRAWHNAKLGVVSPGGRRLHRLTITTAALAYLQLVVGANLRHVPVGASPDVFRTAVFFHLLLAGLLLAQILVLGWTVRREFREFVVLRRPTGILCLLITAQICLGGATWVVKYSWPAWLSQFRFAAQYTVQSDSLLQATTVTAHVALGSLILATSVLLMLRSLRVVATQVKTVHAGTRMLEVIA